VIGTLVLCLAALGSPATGGELTPAELAALDLNGYPRSMRPPGFAGRTPDGRAVSLAGLAGQAVLVNFWASWCRECRPEMPVLEGLHRKFASQGLAVVAVNAREDGETVRRYARELGLTFALVLDPDGAISRRYGVIGLPTTVLIGRDGRPVALAIGPRDWGGPAAEAIIRSLLSDAPRRVP
jgi:peroxiredoxin